MSAGGLIAGVLLLTVAASAQAFDPPLQKRVVDYGPPDEFAAVVDPPSGVPGPVVVPHDKLTCFYYRNLLVKELTNRWTKGAKFLSFQRFDQARPTCAKEHASREKQLDRNEWSGYFLGVKGDLVFFEASDGTDGGLPFAVYDSGTGKQIFNDNAYEGWMWNKQAAPLIGSPFDHIRVRSTGDGNVVLTYLRVLGTECDIANQAAECWSAIVQKLGLKATAAPHCSGYEEIHRTPYHSSLAYPVEVSLFPTPRTHVIAGPTKCWPVD